MNVRGESTILRNPGVPKNYSNFKSRKLDHKVIKSNKLNHIVLKVKINK